jgi:GDPmannose 4,6-dehydratase
LVQLPGAGHAWRGQGVEEIGYDADSGQTLVTVNLRYFHPKEVDILRGDATKVRTLLGWQPRHRFQEMEREMVAHDLREAERALLCQQNNL